MSFKAFGYWVAAASALLAASFQLTTIAIGLIGDSTPSLYPLCLYVLAGYDPDCGFGADPGVGMLVMATVAGLLFVAARRWSGEASGGRETEKLLIYPLLIATAYLVVAAVAFALLVPISTITNLTDPVVRLFTPVVYGGFVLVYVGSFVGYADT